MNELHVIKKSHFSSSGMSKAILLGALYLCQNAPKGYLKYLPIILREKKTTLKELSSLALFSLPELLKPVISVLFDLKRLSSPIARKKSILAVQLLLILLFGLFMTFEKPTVSTLAVLFTMTNLLVSVHDAAVDGLAVQILLPSEQAVGAFGQYAGSKFGALLTNGLLPVLLGHDHRTFCLGINVILVSVMVFTAVFNVSKHSFHHESEQTSSHFITASSFSHLAQRYMVSPNGASLVIVLLLYKFAEHGLDFLWTMMLVDEGIDRKAIIGTQFLVGTVSAIFGAAVGSWVTTICRTPALSLTVCACMRVVPEAMQLMFALSHRCRSLMFVLSHSLLENIAGSAVTASMFSFLLAHSDRHYPASTYAYMNTVAVVGMRAGEWLAARHSHHSGYQSSCVLGLLLNMAFPAVVYILHRLNFLS